VSRQLEEEFNGQKPALDQAFWSPEKKIYAFALDRDNQRVNEPSVLATVPMWFGLPDAIHANEMITQLADADHETDWGMRIISSRSANYDGSGYHFGSVWPLFTGWASVGEYRYHRVLPAYANLRANALLALDGSLGHVTEVLSGDYYESLSTASPHQIWSAAMVVSPILRGLFGLETDAESHRIMLAPHAPADWPSFAIRNVHVGSVSADFQYRKTTDRVVLEIKSAGSGDCVVEFSPAFSLRTQVTSVEMNGRPMPFKLQPSGEDQHLPLRLVPHEGSNVLVIRVKNDFGLATSNDLPPGGSTSRSVRVVSESWNAGRDQLTVELSGVPGRQYELVAWNPQQIRSVEGAGFTKSGSFGKVLVQFPEGVDESYVHRKVILHFGKPSGSVSVQTRRNLD
jgi:hypothetical protein